MGPHAIDEIWRATLLQMNRNIQKRLGRIRIRVILGLMLVVDAKKAFIPIDKGLYNKSDRFRF